MEKLEIKNLFTNKGIEDVKLEFVLDFPDVEAEGKCLLKNGVRVTMLIKLTSANVIKIKEDIKYRYFAVCDRCLEKYEEEREASYEHSVYPGSSEEKEDNIYLKDGYLMIREMVREDVLLDFPVKNLCSEDCKGLCFRCGKNLNLGDCSCDK